MLRDGVIYVLPSDTPDEVTVEEIRENNSDAYQAASTRIETPDSHAEAVDCDSHSC